MLPTQHNTHGIHAWRFKPWAYAYSGGVRVLGRVKLWGQIVEHQDGYRAQYAKITWLDTPNLMSISAFEAMALRQLYRIAEQPPMSVFDDMMSRLKP